MTQLVAHAIDLFPKVGRALRNVLGRQRRYERRAHHRAVLVGDVGVAQNHAAPLVKAAERRERRAEQEERNAAPKVEAPYLREHRERRVVHHDAPVRVIRVFVVAAGPERAHEPRAVYAPSALDV